MKRSSQCYAVQDCDKPNSHASRRAHKHRLHHHCKIIVPEIVNRANSSLITFVPILSVSPSWFIHVEHEWYARNPTMKSEFQVKPLCIEDPPAFLHDKHCACLMPHTIKI
jgi:hypothetical protein